MISKEIIDQYLNYQPETGVFVWRERDEKHPGYGFRTRGWNTVFAGTIAGKANKNGYIYIHLCKKMYLAHRLAWMTAHGFMPDEIDHINHDPSDNRITNLRAVDRITNCKNITKPSDNTSGFVGVYWHKGAQKWMAQIVQQKRSIYLGLFNSKEAAFERRKQAEDALNFHKNHGLPANDNVMARKNAS